MGSQLTPQDIQAIVQAISSTPEMEWVRNQMGSGGPTSAGGGGAGPQQAAPGGQQGPPQQPEGHYMGHQQYMSHQPGQQQPLPRYSGENDGDLELRERYSKVTNELVELKERYSKLNQVNEDLLRSVAQTRQAVIALEKHNCDKDREMQIKDLYQKYPHFVQVEEELDRCLYSRGSTLDTDQFTTHLESVERYAQRSSPVTGMIPQGTVANPIADKERYEAQVAEMIVDRYHRYEKQGEYRTYDQLEAEIRKELGGK